jgi:hypothetical protein
MERVNMFDFFLLNEGTTREFKFITANEFDFLYNCIDGKGKYNEWVGSKNINKLINKILKYLNVQTTFVSELESYTECTKARNKIKQEVLIARKKKKEEALKSGKKFKDVNTLKDVKNYILNTKGEYEVQMACTTIPKFMNEQIQLIFDNININIKTIEQNNNFNDFISLHIDIFIDFFTSRNREENKKEPRTLLYKQLVDLYTNKSFKKIKTKAKKGKKEDEKESVKKIFLMELESSTPNYIYNLYNSTLSKDEEIENPAYAYECKKFSQTINKLLCALTKNRDSSLAFDFEKQFEHTTQFRPYKGNISFSLQTPEDMKTTIKKIGRNGVEADVVLDDAIKEIYLKLFNIIFNDKDVLELMECLDPYLNDVENPEACRVRMNAFETIQKKIIETEIKVALDEDNTKKTKGDVLTTKGIRTCDNKYVMVKSNSKIEIKFFDENTIKGKNNTLHITRILEPNSEYLIENIKTNINKKSAQFTNLFKLVLNSVIEIVKVQVEKSSEKIESISKKTAGIIIAGPKYIPNENNWDFIVYEGSEYQRGEGVGIKLQLPANFTAYDMVYDYETRGYCLKV